jgi:hypothetical protein
MRLSACSVCTIGVAAFSIPYNTDGPIGSGVSCPDSTGKLINIAAVGDSITQGAHSSGGNTTYPGQVGCCPRVLRIITTIPQLQILLDAKYPKTYCVTNLGEGGATMQEAPFGDSPYWKRGSFGTLTGFAWDMVVIMLGTNDAKVMRRGGAGHCACALTDRPACALCCQLCRTRAARRQASATRTSSRR